MEQTIYATSYIHTHSYSVVAISNLSYVIHSI